MLIDKTEEVSGLTPINEVVKSVVKDNYEWKSNEGIVTITIEDKDIHKGSKPQILKDSAEIFAGLSKIAEVTSATISWYAPLTDQYGNKKMDEVLAIMIDGDTF